MKKIKIDPNKIIDKPLKLIIEGTVGDCPECGSSTIKTFWIKKMIGCISPKCINYYENI